MSDPVERWAVLELLSDRRCNTNCFDESGQKIYEELTKAIESVKDLPSAQPEPLTVNFAREMDRGTIERLKDELKNAPVLIMAVNDSAQSEIIRCKDCKHYDDGLCRRWKYSHVTSEESFCSGAERREERD